MSRAQRRRGRTAAVALVDADAVAHILSNEAVCLVAERRAGVSLTHVAGHHRAVAPAHPSVLKFGKHQSTGKVQQPRNTALLNHLNMASGAHPSVSNLANTEAPAKFGNSFATI